MTTYEGSNDVNAGQPADEIVDHFEQCAARVARRLPQTRIFFVSPLRSPDKRYTDGLHITPEASVAWGKILRPFLAA